MECNETPETAEMRCAATEPARECLSADVAEELM